MNTAITRYTWDPARKKHTPYQQSNHTTCFN